MSIFPIYTAKEGREGILKRPPLGEATQSPSLARGIAAVFGEPLSVEAAVGRILHDIRRQGDAALRRWTKQIDKIDLPADLRIPQSEIDDAFADSATEIQEALQFSADRIREFHEKQPTNSWLDRRDDGGALGQEIRPLERVAVYVPGGTAAYPSTLLMCAVTARVAGVPEVVVVTPAGRNGKVAPIILAAAKVAGVSEVYPIGGAQGIGAVAFGTETIRSVDKIVGPGNIFVVTAKRQVYGIVDIDGLPGPTETLVIAEADADAALVAADLLAQAEHDTQSAAILVTPSRALAEAVQAQIDIQIEPLTRADIIRESMSNQGGAVISADIAEAVELNNLYGPEHLCLHVDDPWPLVPDVKNAGGIFLGEHAYEVLGDYTAGPTHVMPTMGTARFASPLSVRDFTKIISIFGLSAAESARISPAAEILADAEGLTAHAAAVRIRRG
jgi:histidinol dehydrogenase